MITSVIYIKKKQAWIKSRTVQHRDTYSFNHKQTSSCASNHGHPWKESDIRLLHCMVNNGFTNAEIAKVLKRKSSAISKQVCLMKKAIRLILSQQKYYTIHALDIKIRELKYISVRNVFIKGL